MFHHAFSAVILSAGIILRAGPLPFGLEPRQYVPPPAEFVAPPSVGGGCLSPGEARAAVQSGQVVPLSSVLGQIRQAAGGQIVSTPTLCNMGGRLIYSLDVLSAGAITHMQVDARTGRIGP
ncbi:MAG TPA: hypothetical protein VII35_01865 [Steroidobacteraceae bacterium]